MRVEKHEARIEVQRNLLQEPLVDCRASEEHEIEVSKLVPHALWQSLLGGLDDECLRLELMLALRS